MESFMVLVWEEGFCCQVPLVILDSCCDVWNRTCIILTPEICGILITYLKIFVSFKATTFKHAVTIFSKITATEFEDICNNQHSFVCYCHFPCLQLERRGPGIEWLRQCRIWFVGHFAGIQIERQSVHVSQDYGQRTLVSLGENWRTYPNILDTVAAISWSILWIPDVFY